MPRIVSEHESVVHEDPHISFYTSFMNQLVDIIRCDTWDSCGSGNIQHFSSYPTNLSHGVLTFFVEYSNLISTCERSLAVWDTISPIIGTFNVLGDLSVWGERVYRSERSSEGKGWEGIEETGIWVGFRDCLWSYKVTEEITLRFVHGLVGALRNISF